MKNTEETNFLYWRGTSLYLNITNRCPNACLFCVRNYREGVFGFNLFLKREPEVSELVSLLTPNTLKGFSEVVFTGFGEPLVRLDTVLAIVKNVKTKKPQLTVRIDTNGLAQLLHPKRAIVSELATAGVDSLSISLNAGTAKEYLRLCKPAFGLRSFAELLNFAKKAKKVFAVTLTIVAVPKLDVTACEELAKQMNIPLRIRPYNGPVFSW